MSTVKLTVSALVRVSAGARLPPSRPLVGLAAATTCPAAVRRTLHTSQTRWHTPDPAASTSEQRPQKLVPPPASDRGPKRGRVPTLVIGLSIAGLAITAVGLVDYFSSFKTWPKELRSDLRTAIKARNSGDARRSEKYFRKVLETARSLPPSELGNDRLIKLTGISIALGSLLESEADFWSAYQVYAESLDEVLGRSSDEGSTNSTIAETFDAADQGSTRNCSPQERMRAVTLAQKLGDLASSGLIAARSVRDQDGNVVPVPMDLDSIAEQHYVWSVEELLRLIMDDSQRSAALAADERGEQGGVVLSELGVPAWISEAEVGGSLEALAGFYASRGKGELAVPLYLQALAFLMPPDSSAPPSVVGEKGRQPTRRKNPTASERCRAAILMNNLAQIIIHSSPSSSSGSSGGVRQGSVTAGLASDQPGRNKQAIQWAEQGLGVVYKTQAMVGWPSSCASSAAATSVGGTAREVIETSSDRTRQVELECGAAEVTLLYNLGMMHQLQAETNGVQLSRSHPNVCNARDYYAKAYRRAEEIGLRDAKNRTAMALAELERKSTK